PMGNLITYVMAASNKISSRLDKAGVYHSLLLLVAAWVLFQIGRRLLKRFNVNLSSAPEEFVFSAGLGFGIIIYATFLLGILGLLYRGVFRGLGLLLVVIFAKDFVTWLKSRAHAAAPLKPPAAPPPSWGSDIFRRALYIVLIFYAVIYM